MDDGDHTVMRPLENRVGEVAGMVDQAGADVHASSPSTARSCRSVSTSPSRRSIERWPWKSASTRTTARRSPISKPPSVASVRASTTRSVRCRSACSSSRTSSRGQRPPGRPHRRCRQGRREGDQRRQGTAVERRRRGDARAHRNRPFIAAQRGEVRPTALRMAEIEAQLADEMDVSAAVQLERLEETRARRGRAQPRPVRAQDRSGDTAGGRTFPGRRASHDPTLPARQRYHTHRSRASRRSDAELVTAPLAGDGRHGTLQRRQGNTDAPCRCRAPGAGGVPGEAAAECMKAGQMLVEGGAAHRREPGQAMVGRTATCCRSPTS